MFLMDRFFNGAFLTFGLEVIAFAERDQVNFLLIVCLTSSWTYSDYQEDRLDPMIYIFPRMTKCTFHKFGTSGEVEKHDALCILPLNIGTGSHGKMSSDVQIYETKLKSTVHRI